MCKYLCEENTTEADFDTGALSTAHGSLPPARGRRQAANTKHKHGGGEGK